MSLDGYPNIIVTTFNWKKDPNHARESKRYAHPVVSREFIVQYLTDMGCPVSLDRLLTVFSIKKNPEKEGLRRRLIAMERDGQIMRNRRRQYALVENMELLRGSVHLHRDGFGFLIPDDGSNDVFLAAREVRAVLDNDTVLVRISDIRDKGREGRIVEILSRNTQQLVGRYFESRGIAFVSPYSKNMIHDIVIPNAGDGEIAAKLGQFVLVQITDQPTARTQAMGRIMAVLGDPDTPGIAIALATQAYGLPHQWSTSVEQEVKALEYLSSVEVDGSRENLTSLPFVTIDGEDSQDFDDAVYCEAVSEGWVLYVAIADVSHYVKPDTALDQEAQKRGNSVYFPMHVLPMLPEILSNHWCSLRPHVNRCVIVCKMRFNQKAELLGYQFFEAVICSHARLTYTEVAGLLEGTIQKHRRLLPHLQSLYKLYQKLWEQRIYRGAIEFETTETRIQFNAKGKIKCIVPIIRNVAHKIIEECMLAANVCASFFLKKANMPTLYRVHEGPDQQKLKDLRQFLRAFSLRLTGGDKPTSRDYVKLLSRIEKRSDVYLLQTVILRSFQQAIYTAKSEGHFGLSYAQYCHFTSPIRRYPDLLVHRGIKHLLKYQRFSKVFPYDQKIMEHLGSHCSVTERRADRATRDVTDWLKSEYMMNKVGKIFDAHIVDVRGFGVFVGLDDLYVSGLVHVTALKNDYYHFDPVRHVLEGKKTGQKYRLGDSLRVLVARVDLDERKIDFELVDD